MPGGGPSLDGKKWRVTKDPRRPNRTKPYLTDRDALADAFRRHYLAGVQRLLRRGKLQIEVSDDALSVELQKLESLNWNVCIQGPPEQRSRPSQVLKYLARYLTGGPISSKRLISSDDHSVKFWARSRDRANRSRPFTLSDVEFVRRWAMHILPKGFTRSRSYGGYHPAKREEYLHQCRRLLRVDHEPEQIDPPPVAEDSTPTLPQCHHCGAEMSLESDQPRPSWRDVFTIGVYQRADIYCPLLHIGHSRPPPPDA